MRLRRVTAKQKHQMNMDQLLRSALQALSLATRDKATQVESNCSRRKKKPMMVTELRPEDDHVVMWITDIRMAVIFVKELRRWIESDKQKKFRVQCQLRLRICGVGSNGPDTWVTAQLLQNGSPHPSPLTLSQDLSYPTAHSWIGSGIKP